MTQPAVTHPTRMRLDTGAFIVPALDAAEESAWRLTGKDPGPLWHRHPDHTFSLGTGVVRSLRLRTSILAVKPALRTFLIECSAEILLNRLIRMRTNLLDLVEGAETEIHFRKGDSLQFWVNVTTASWAAYSAVLRAMTPPELVCALILDCDVELEIV